MLSFANISGIIEAVFGLLLLAVLYYAIRLNKYISALKKNKAQLQALVDSFNQSTNRAESAIFRMKQACEENQNVLEGQIAKAKKAQSHLEDVIAVASLIGDNAAVSSDVSPQGGNKSLKEISGDMASGRSHQKTFDDLREKARLQAKPMKDSSPKKQTTPQSWQRSSDQLPQQDGAMSMKIPNSPSESEQVAQQDFDGALRGEMKTNLSPTDEQFPQSTKLRNQSKVALMKALKGIQ